MLNVAFSKTSGPVEKLIYFTIAFLLGSALDTNPIKVAVSCILALLFVQQLKKNEWVIRVSREFIALAILLLICIFNSVYYLLFEDFNVESNLVWQALNVRKFAIEAFFAFFLYFYLKSKSIDEIFDLLFWGLFANSIVGIVEIYFVLTQNYRASMLFFEPSSAGFYYNFCIFLMFLGVRGLRYRRRIAKSFTFIGLFALSKAQYLVLLIVGFFALSLRKKLLLASLAISASLLFSEEIFGIYESLVSKSKAVYGLDVLLNSVGSQGIYGLSSDYGVYETYVTRLSAIYVALITLIKYPLGIGIATFNLWYQHYLIDTGLVHVFMGEEVNGMFEGVIYASPRSRILELLIGAGVFGLFCLIYIFRSFFIFRKKERLLYFAFLSTFIAGLILELNPILDYFVVLIILLEKYRESRTSNLNSCHA